MQSYARVLSALAMVGFFAADVSHAAPPPTARNAPTETASPSPSPVGDVTTTARELKNALAKYKRTRSEEDAATITACFQKLSQAGAGGVAPIAEAVSDPKWASQAVTTLAGMFAANAAQPGAQSEPLSVAKLDQPTVNLLTRIVLQVKAVGMQKTPASKDAVALLAAIAPRIPSAMSALADLAIADRVPPESQTLVAAVMANADAATKKKLEAASSHAGESLKAILDSMHFWALPPADAAKQLLAMPAPQRDAAIAAFPNDPKRTMPILIELLADPNTQEMPAVNDAAALPFLKAALKSPSPRVRLRIARRLRDSDPAGSSEAILSVLGTDPDLSAEAMTEVQNMGEAALPPTLTRAKDTSAAVRASAAQAFGPIAQTILGRNAPTSPPMKSIADELVKLLVDSDPTVRAAAANSVAIIGEPMQPQLEAALKTMTPEQRHEIGMVLITPVTTARGPMQSNIIQQMTASKDPVISDFANQIISEKSMADLGITGPDVAATQPAVAADYPPAIVPILAKLKVAKSADEARLVSAQLTLDQNVPAATKMLFDADYKARLAAVMFFLEWKDSPKSPSVVTTLAMMAMNDPAAAVRSAIKTRLASSAPNGDWQNLMPLRLQAMARNADEQQRIAAAWYYLNSANFGGSPDWAVAPLRKLSEDSSEKVRVLAAKAVAKFAGLQNNSESPAALLVLHLLSGDQPAVRQAAMYQIDRFDDKTVRSLAGSTDPDVKTAVMFLLSYGDRNSPVRGQKVGFDVATAALASPSPGVRKLASEVMLWNDPNDKKRIDRGYDALLQATLNPREDAALDAIEALIPFAKQAMPDYGEDSHTLPDGTKAGFVEWLAYMLATAANGTEAEKIAFLNMLSKDTVMHYFDKWDQLKEIFSDPNPKVRAAAFSSAHDMIKQANDKRIEKNKPDLGRFAPRKPSA